MAAPVQRVFVFVIVFWLCCLGLGVAAASSRVVTYQVRSGDTAESIAAEFYGNRARANLILEFNHLPAASLKPGQILRIPTAYRYKINQGEDLRAVAQRLVGDARRAPLLLQLSELKPMDKVPAGTEIQVPFHFPYTVRKGDTLVGIAKSYYGDASRARLLMSYNFLPRPSPPAVGERLVVPIVNIRVRSVRLVTAPPRRPPPPVKALRPPAPQKAAPAPAVAAPAEPTQTEEARIAEEVRARLQRAEQLFAEGAYAEVHAVLVRLITEVDPTEAQLVEIHRLMAFAYVALGERDMAVSAFREVLDRRPDFKLDAVLTSPKILSALQQAKRREGP